MRHSVVGRPVDARAIFRRGRRRLSSIPNRVETAEIALN
jgi:hypothetical protein